MVRNIKIKAVPNQSPNVRLYVLALIALARQMQEEARESGEPSLRQPQPEATQPPTSGPEASRG